MRTNKHTATRLQLVSPERLLGLIILGLLAYMPFHLFVTQWLSMGTGGREAWNMAKDIITMAVVVLALWVAVRARLFRNRWILGVFGLTVVYGLLHVLFFVFDRKDQDVRSFLVALLFNGRVLAYLFIAVVAGMASKLSLRTALKVVLIASTITCLFAFVQYLGPRDMMEYFGYGVDRGAKPSFYIDDKPDFPRVMSTVRDPNSYGAYLLVPICALFVLLGKVRFRSKLLIVLLGLHVAALALTFSRGAWLGALVALGVTAFVLYRDRVRVLSGRAVPLAVGMVVLLLAGTYLFKDTYIFQNVILHSDQSTVLADPNELRVQLQSKALNAIVDDPEGHGPGTAGLASIENPKGTFLTENYFLQIGYELGVIGLAVLITVLALVHRLLCIVGQKKVRAAALGAFWGYILMGLLIHLWSNEAVAAQGWLLGGLVLGMFAFSSHKQGSATR